MTAQSPMKCNRCWKKLQGVAYITECCHVFCESDAREVFSTQELLCPLCDTPLQQRGITQVDLTNTMKKTIALCGLTPKMIVDIAGKAIEFYGYQKEVEYEFKQSKYAKREEQLQQMEKTYQEKILESSNKIALLTHQMETLKGERDTDRKELQDLKEKYAEKSRQKRKLAELYETLKKKHGDTTSSVPSSPPEHGQRLTTPPFSRPSAPRTGLFGGADQQGQRQGHPAGSPGRDSRDSRPFGLQRPQEGRSSGHHPQAEKIDRFSLARNVSSPQRPFPKMPGNNPPSSPSPRFSFGAVGSDTPLRPETPARRGRTQGSGMFGGYSSS